MAILDDANSYFNTRLHVESWTNSNDTDKTNALNDALRIIDSFGYIEEKVEQDQIHEFPRTNIGTPNEILYAQYEIALAFLSGYDLEKSGYGRNVTSRGISSVRTTYDSTLIPEHVRAGVPSLMAWNYLSPYLDRESSGSLKLHRVD